MHIGLPVITAGRWTDMGPEHLPIQTVGVTGANGYVGSRIAAAVEVAGHRVIRLIRSPQSGSSDRYYALNSEL